MVKDWRREVPTTRSKCGTPLAPRKTPLRKQKAGDVWRRGESASRDRRKSCEMRASGTRARALTSSYEWNCSSVHAEVREIFLRVECGGAALAGRSHSLAVAAI